MKQTQTEIRLAGNGGQGLITAGIILAEAAILDNKNVVQSQSYGPEARGGASRAEIIIAKQRNGPVDKLKVVFHKAYASFYPLSMEREEGPPF